MEVPQVGNNDESRVGGGMVVVVNDDPAIRLFGANIIPMISSDAHTLPLHPQSPPPPPAAQSTPSMPSETRKEEVEQGVSRREDGNFIYKEGDGSHKQSADANMEASNQKPVDSSGAECSSGRQDKASQPLPCPRCNSTKTKFCYFNNYNVNQPRHFCKSCHRYWTAGGKVRNVSQSGRRKNKASCPENQLASASSGGGPTSQVDISPADQTQLSSQQPSEKSQMEAELMTNGDSPLDGSVMALPALQDKKNFLDTAKVNLLDRVSLPLQSLVFADNEVSGNTPIERNEVSGTASIERPRISAIGPCGLNSNALPILQGFPRPPWIYPYEIDWKGMACGSKGGGQGIAPRGSSAMIAPRVCTPNSVSPFVHPSLWDSDAGVRNLQPNSNLSHEPSTSNGSSLGQSSQSLGKHSRDLTSFNEENARLSVLKTPRMNGQEVAAHDASRASFEK